KVRTLLNTLNMNYSMDNLTFSSVTSYLDLKFNHMNNYDQTSYGLANSAIGERSKIFSQELRLVSDFDGPLNFTLGGYYEKFKRTPYADTPLVFVGPDPVTGRFDNFQGRNKATGNTISGFGQLRWDILENLELAGGVRYTKEKRTQSVQNDFK